MDHRTLRNSSQLRLPAEVLLLIVQASLPVYDLHPRQWNDELLRSCCLVCGAWRRICQEKLFENVILRSADQFDRLRSLKEIQSSAHLLTCIHRIIFHYKSPYYKLGEVIPRLVELYLPNLKSLEISSQSFGNDSPAFPIHHSFRRYTSRLSTVHFLKISRFKFTHLAEFRIFLGIFGGLRHLEVPNIQLGTDRQGDYRLLHRTQNQSLQVVTSTFYHADSVGRKYLLPIFWMNDRRGLVEPADVTSETITETLCPVLTPDAARLLVSIHELCQKGDKNVEWTCMDGKKQQWKLASNDSYFNAPFCISLWIPGSTSTSNRPVFSLSDLRSIQINLQDVNLDEEIEDTFKNFQLLDDPLGNMENLEELDVTVRVSVTWEDEGEVPNEVFLGYGQLVAENPPQVRQRCSLKIRHGSISQHVCWRHLFEQGAVVEDRGDYRDQTRKFCSYVLMLRRLKMEEREKEEDRKKKEKWKKKEGSGKGGGEVAEQLKEEQ